MKILIVDDHAVVREGVAAVLGQAFDGAAILHAADVETGIAVADDHPDLDIVLLDLSMPGISGMAALDAFGTRHGAIPVVVLSSSEMEGDVRGAIAHGALGYVAKTAKPLTLVAAIRFVLGGEIYVPSFMVLRPAVSGATSQRGVALTARQRDILALVASAASNKEIAHRLAISEKTVKAHLTSIFRALNVANRAEAVRSGPCREHRGDLGVNPP